MYIRHILVYLIIILYVYRHWDLRSLCRFLLVTLKSDTKRPHFSVILLHLEDQVWLKIIDIIILLYGLKALQYNNIFIGFDVISFFNFHNLVEIITNYDHYLNFLHLRRNLFLVAKFRHWNFRLVESINIFRETLYKLLNIYEYCLILIFTKICTGRNFNWNESE